MAFLYGCPSGSCSFSSVINSSVPWGRREMNRVCQTSMGPGEFLAADTWQGIRQVPFHVIILNILGALLVFVSRTGIAPTKPAVTSLSTVERSLALWVPLLRQSIRTEASPGGTPWRGLGPMSPDVGTVRHPCRCPQVPYLGLRSRLWFFSPEFV